MMEHIPVRLLKLIYPLKEIEHTRDRPLRVLCLGFGRTGTESLHTALLELGYSDVHHGFRLTTAEGVGEAVQWYRLALAKYKDGDTAFLNRGQFDKIIGDCEATTDMPCAAFGLELLRAYPEAKVVLNRRKDVDTWYQSQVKTIDRLYQEGPEWRRQWFCSETFWLARTVMWIIQRPMDWDFKQNGVQKYHEHYAELEQECWEQGREWLDWTIEDGWKPLCEFLDMPVPDGEFPSGNAPDDFAKKRAEIHHGRIVRADRNMAITGASLIAGVAGAVAWWTIA